MTGTGFRFSIALLCLSLVGLGATVVPTRAKAASDDGWIPGEVLVSLSTADDLPYIAEHYGLDPTPIDHFDSRPIYRLRIIDGSSPYDKSSQLEADYAGRVHYADPNYEGQTPESRGLVRWAVGNSSTEYATQWVSSKIRLSQAHAVTRGGGIKVAVLDTGVDFNHPALKSRLLPGYDFVDNDADPKEEGSALNPAFGHGTHVAGLVALVAPDAKIMPVRVLDPDGFGNAWNLCQAVLYAIDPDGNPQTHDGADVINLSLSMLERSHMLRDVLRAATCAEAEWERASSDDVPCFLPEGRGAVVVMAAGNSGSSTKEYPAGDSIDGSVSVGASTQKDDLALFSNFGSWVAVKAPGQNIISSVPGGYATWSGTSMAAPIVAGEAALVRAAFPSFNTEAVADRILSTSARTSDPVRYRIDAAAAVGVRTRNLEQDVDDCGQNRPCARKAPAYQ